MKQLNNLQAHTIQFLSLITVSIFSIHASAQTSSGNEYFSLIYDGPEYFSNLIEVGFLDTETDSAMKTISLPELNPFNNLNLEKIDKSKYASFKHYNRYIIGDLMLKKFKLTVGQFVLNKSIDENRNIKGATLLSYHSWDIVDSTIVINFEASLGYDAPMAVSSVFFVFDQYGNLLDEITQLEHNCNEFTVTSDRKYFVCVFGGGDDSPFGYFDKPGYLIYSTANHKVIYQEIFDVELYGLGVRNHGNIVEIGLVHPDSEDKIYLHFAKGKKYTISLPDQIVFNIRKTLDFGIITKASSTDTLFFERDFKSEEFIFE